MTYAGLTREQFLRDVRNHQMLVLRNDWRYRHLQFADPSTSNQWFEIITWPGALAMSGDMGSWLFRREQDMFGFFRITTGEINPDYWHEKLEAVDRHGAQEFNADVFRADALAHLDNWALDESRLASVRANLSEHLNSCDAEEELRQAWAESEVNGEPLDPSDMPSGMVYTHRYLWACHAIVWAIQQFDQLRAVR